MRRGLLARHISKMRKVYAHRRAAMDAALKRHIPEGARWTRPAGGMCLWLELPLGFDSSELLIHVRERGVLFSPGRYFYVQNPRPNALRLAFTNVDEKRITRGIAVLADSLKQELRKRHRGASRMESPRVALV
jgi:2-aminoadipate transaminase